MKLTDKNIIMITAGGIGERFEDSIPKQYVDLNGRPVISYVIEACKKSRLADSILIAADRQYHEKIVSTYGVDVTDSGPTLNITKRNGLNYLRQHSSCEKLVVVEAVRPTLTSHIIDRIFMLLDKYEAVACARKITDSLGHYGEWIVNREEYYTLYPPEGFRFPLIERYFKSDSEYTESIQQLPESTNVYLDFDVPYFDKITYPEDMDRMKSLINIEKNDLESAISVMKDGTILDYSCLYTKGINNFLYIREKKDTVRWINQLQRTLPEVFRRWSVISFSVNQIARYGIVLLANSDKYGTVAVKCIPDFINIYEREKEAMTLLSNKFMCPLIEADDNTKIMLLKQIVPGKYASFDHYRKMISFFKKVHDNAVAYDYRNRPIYIPLYYDELKYRYDNAEQVPYLSEPIKYVLEYALLVWNKFFKNESLYIIHGDLHELNILDDNEQLWGIDPCGFVAPLVFENVRFIRNDIRNHADFGYEERFDVLMHCFEQFANQNQLLAAFIVDMAFCTYNSTFENVDTEETLLDIKLFEIARKRLESIGENPIL